MSMNDRLMVFAAGQLWQIPFLVLYILGVILALNNRRIGNAARYAAIGFGALALSQCVSSVQSYLIADMRLDGSHDIGRMAAISTVAFTIRTVLAFGGMGLIMAAIFAKRPAPDPSRL